MAKMTVLEMTQNILSALDGDEVNSINDTVESFQVATVLGETYEEVLSSLTIPSKEALVQLEGLGDLTKPNYLRIPDDVKDILWIKYDYRTNGFVDYHKVQLLVPEDFLTMVNLVGNQSSVLDVTDFSGSILQIKTDHSPQWYTTFDNEYIVFDSYDSSLDSTLQQSKTQCWGEFTTTFTLDDDFIPILDDDMFPLLLAEAKSTCFINQKQISSSKEEQRSRRLRMKRQNDDWRANQRKPYNRTPNYGRTGSR